MKQVICLLLATLVCFQLQSTNAAPASDKTSTVFTVGDNVKLGGNVDSSLYKESNENPAFNAAVTSVSKRSLSVIRPLVGKDGKVGLLFESIPRSASGDEVNSSLYEQSGENPIFNSGGQTSPVVHTPVKTDAKVNSGQSA